MYIKDTTNGKVRLYGESHHDALCISENGRNLSYENLQNGDGSRFGAYRFCDKDGKVPEEDEALMRHGAESYFNIGGFDNEKSDKPDNKVIKSAFNKTYDDGISDAIDVLSEMAGNYVDSICDTVIDMDPGWCENNCKHEKLTPDCIKKYIKMKLVEQGKYPDSL